MGPIKALLSFLGRALLVSIFLMASVHHFQEFDKITEGMVAKNVPQAKNVHYAAVGCMIVGGVLVLVGFMGRIGALLLIGFLAGASYYMHNFWAFPVNSAEWNAELMNFTRNAALLGGLLFIFANGSCAGAIDRQKVSVSV